MREPQVLWRDWFAAVSELAWPKRERGEYWTIAEEARSGELWRGER